MHFLCSHTKLSHYFLFSYGYFAKKTDITWFQVISNQKFQIKEAAKVSGWLKSDSDFGFGTRSKRNGSTGSSSFWFSSTQSL